MIEEKVLLEGVQVKITTLYYQEDQMDNYITFSNMRKKDYLVIMSWEHWGHKYYYEYTSDSWLDCQNAKLQLPEHIRKTKEKAKEVVRKEISE